MGVPFLYRLVEFVLIHEPETATADASAMSAAAQGVATRAHGVDGDAPVKDKYVRMEDPVRTGGTTATKPETIANTATKPEVVEDAYVALEAPEEEGDDGVASDTSKGDKWLLFFESLGYKIRG